MITETYVWLKKALCAQHNFGKKKRFFKFLIANKIQLWVISTNLGIQENFVKTWGHLRIIFLLSANTPPESKTILKIFRRNREQIRKIFMGSL